MFQDRDPTLDKGIRIFDALCKHFFVEHKNCKCCVKIFREACSQ